MDNISFSYVCPYCGKYYLDSVKAPFHGTRIALVYDCKGNMVSKGCGRRFMVELVLEYTEHVYKIEEVGNETKTGG